jgi:hypothetical protein
MKTKVSVTQPDFGIDAFQVPCFSMSARLLGVSLQFDGVTDDAYVKIR